jgi:site-specific DNA-methyltransferase (adenine-specific)
MKPFYENEHGKLFNAECIEVLQKGKPNSIDMILCDLPYGTTQNKWDIIIPFEPLWKEYNRILKTNGVIALTASQPFTSMVVMSNIDYNAKFPKEKIPTFRHEWIWIKNRGSNFANTVREPFKEHESVLIFSRGKWTYNRQMQERTGAGLDRIQYNVKFETSSDNYREFETRAENKLPELRVPSSWQKFNTEVGLHPNQKPVPLFEYLIKTYSNEGDLILDNCGGSGTTAIASENLNRRWILIEKETKYCETIVSRLSERKQIINKN